MFGVSLADLPYDYSALEPHISGEIIELHHDKHHAADVAGANQTLEQLEEDAAGLECVESYRAIRILTVS